MGVLELLKRGVFVASKSTQLVLVLFVFSLFTNLVNLFVGRNETQVDFILSAVITFVFVFISIFIQAGSLGYIQETIKQGSSTLETFKTAAKKFFVRILGINVVWLLFILIVSILSALGFLIGGENVNILSLLLALVVALVGVYGLILVFWSPYIAVTDDATVIQSLSRSIKILKSDLNVFKALLSLVLAPGVAIAYAALPRVRESAYGKYLFVRVVVIGFWLLLAGFAVGLLFAGVAVPLASIMGETALDIFFRILSSLINAYIGVVFTATFMTYYLSLKSNESAPPAPTG